MIDFQYRQGQLHVEDVPLAAIAASVGTPVYVYSRAGMERQYTQLADALRAEGLSGGIHYAMKANDNLAVLRGFAALGAGCDVVSEGELRRALAAGIPAGRIVFSGVGKTRGEMEFALKAGIFQFNVESEPELEALSQVATALGATAAIAIRVNPDVDAKTHEKISTGRKEDKFGIDWDRARAIYAKAAALPGIEPASIAMHIGSQLTDLEPFRAAFLRMKELARTLIGDGIALKRLDVGGGLGVAYRPDQAEPPSMGAYARMLRETLGDMGLPLMLEPGRVLVANAGVLLARVVYVKDGTAKRFVILDAAMNDLIRPALYDGWHWLRPLAEPAPGAAVEPADVVGPICESGDRFAANRPLPPLAAGDLVAFHSAGAYGSVMASTYNARPLVPEVLVSGRDWAVIRPRQSYEELMGADRFAPWQEGSMAGTVLKEARGG